MISLAVLYVVQDAPFLFAVQIIVYTGAILMLFLFVLMLVGVDASDSVVETIRGQRLVGDRSAACCSAPILVIGVGQVTVGAGGRARRRQRRAATSRRSPTSCSASYVFAFEVTRALLITAAARRDGAGPPRAARRRSRPRPSLAAQRMRDYAETGEHLGPLPPPGVFARHNAVDTPALLPDGTPSEASISRVLAARGTVRPPPHGRRHRRDRAADRRRRPRRARRSRRPPPPRRRPPSTDAVHRPLRDPLHDRRRRRAGPAQRDRRVHVRRADAQRHQPRAGHLRPAATATSTARSRRSS